jgi:hypothetical protein
MSSFTRRIQRQLSPSQAVHPDLDLAGDPIVGKFHSNPARKKFFGGRGQRLGTNNPRDTALLARLAREKRNAARQSVG